MSRFNYWDIDESSSEYNIDRLSGTSEAMFKLYAKHFSIFQELARFWKPRLEVAKKCHNYMRRDIFTPGQRKKYMNIQDKWPIEPQEMKPIINTLVGEISDRIRSGTVTMDDDTVPENAASPEVMRVVLKWLENNLDLNWKRKEVLREGLIDGYPQWLWFDKIKSPVGGEDKLICNAEPWESTLCSKWFNKRDGSDITEIMRLKRYSRAELLAMWPNRKKALEEFNFMLKEEPGRIGAMFESETEYDSGNRSNLIYDMIMSQELRDDTGLHTVIEHTYSIAKKREVYVPGRNGPDGGIEYYGDPVVLPDGWSEEQKQGWLNQNQDYKIVTTDKVATLWVTTFQNNGFVWENAEHWYQKQMPDKPYAQLPGVPFIASMEDHIPTGVGEDMLPYILLIAACATEGLSQVRKGTGRVLYYEEGSIRHPKYLKRELSDEEGAVALKKGGIDKIRTEMRKPNDTYMGMEDRYRDRLRETPGVTPAMMGAFAPRQSSIAKEKELNQGMMPQSQYVDNYLSFTLNTTQLMCNMVPYFLTDYQLISIDDEFGRSEKAEINVKEYDWEGNARNVINDLTAADYRIIPTIGDDSTTSREQDLKNFVQMMEAIGNSIFRLMEINPRMIGNFLMSWDNRFAKEAAKYILESAEMVEQQQMQQAQSESQLEMQKQQQRYEVDMAKIKSPNINYKISPEDVQTAPMGFQIMMQYAEQSRQQSGGATPSVQQGAAAPQQSAPALPPQGAEGAPQPQPQPVGV